MNCREFRSKHVGFVDDLLPAAEMVEMRRHSAVCQRCSTLDVRIRRSLLVVRNLPQIEPSADFFARLSERLNRVPAPSSPARRLPMTAAFVAIGAVLAAAVYFAMAIGVQDDHQITPKPVMVAGASERAPVVGSTALVAAVPAGVPVWPAMFMVGELPMHLANAELLDGGIGR